MNSSLNRSGHSELRDPEWFECSSAKLAPTATTTDENDGSLFQNSIASLNLDRSIAEMDLFASVRSLPIFLSSSTNAAGGATSNSGNRSIANLQDAPWNQSPQRIRSSSLSPRRRWKGGMRSSNRNETSSSFMDELQNSLSEITSGVYPTVIVPQQIATSSDETADDLLILESSLMSLRVTDLQPYEEEDDEEADDGETGGRGGGKEQEGNEVAAAPKQQTSASDMDVTAHTGNVSRSVLNHRSGNLDGAMSLNGGPGFSSTSFRQTSSLPSRVQSFNHHHGYQNNNTNQIAGVVSRGSSWNPNRPRTMGTTVNNQTMSSNMSYGSRTGNTFNNSYNNNNNNNNEPSMSTLGDGDDDDDDDNQEIIRMLRNQVNTLKQQLLQEQNKNQLQKQQLQNSRQSLVSNTSEEDSFGEEDDSSFGGGGSSSRPDLDGEKGLANDTNVLPNNKAATTGGYSSSSSSSSPKHQILANLATLKESILRKQRQASRHRDHPSPHDDDDNDEHELHTTTTKEEQQQQQASLLLDELVVCELEQQFRILCQNHARQLQRQVQEHQEAMASARSRIAALESQIMISSSSSSSSSSNIHQPSSSSPSQ